MPTGSVPELLRRMIAEDPGRPRVTWYGPDSERVELSAKTLENWVAKTANFLLDEVDAEAGTTIGLDLPVHWRSVVWLLAGWSVGAHLVVPPDAMLPGTARLDAVVTPHVAAPPSVVTGALVVVALPALATRYSGDLPPGGIDAATEVRLQPDAFPAVSRPSPDARALTVPGPGGPQAISHGDLFAAAPAALAGTLAGSAPRVLTDAGPQLAVDAYLRPLLAGGSLVLHHDLTSIGTGGRTHLIAQEGVTELYPPL
jgi:uncharacterized protein (TIGR03089 family)